VGVPMFSHEGAEKKENMTKSFKKEVSRRPGLARLALGHTTKGSDDLLYLSIYLQMEKLLS